MDLTSNDSAMFGSPQRRIVAMTAIAAGCLLMGVRLTLRGDSAARRQLLLTVSTIGACAALLLLAVSIEPASHSRTVRQASLNPDRAAMSDSGRPSLEVHPQVLRSGPVRVTGVNLAALTPNAPAPPGLSSVPPVGGLAVSPALARLMNSPAGLGLRPRLPEPVIAVIAPEGLVGPDDLRFYRGIAPSHSARPDELATGWGSDGLGDALDPLTETLLTGGLAILIAALLAVAAASGGIGAEGRRGRCAMLRDLGASGGKVALVEVGGAVCSSVAGLIVGAATFYALRPLARWVPVAGDAFFPWDLAPDPLLVGVIAVALVIGAVLARLASIVDRKVLGAEPRRRRGHWRLLIVGATVGVLYLSSTDSVLIRLFGAKPVQLASIFCSLVAVLVGVPYVVEWASRRLPAGGPISWQIAANRLATDSVSAGRSVACLSLVVAGALTLAPLLTVAGPRHAGPVDSDFERVGSLWVGRADFPDVRRIPRLIESAAPRSAPVIAWAQIEIELPSRSSGTGTFAIASCATVIAATRAPTCHDGAVFAVGHAPIPAGPVDIRSSDVSVRWQVPECLTRTTLRSGAMTGPVGLVVTPGALSTTVAAALAHRLTITVVVNSTGHRALTSREFDDVRNALVGYRWRVDDKWLDPATGPTPRQDLLQLATVGLAAGGAAVLIAAVLALSVTVSQATIRARMVLLQLAAAGVPARSLRRTVVIHALVPTAIGILVANVVGAIVTWASLPSHGLQHLVSPVAVLVIDGAILITVLVAAVLAGGTVRGLMNPEEQRIE
jgi:hypothetical protein